MSKTKKQKNNKIKGSIHLRGLNKNLILSKIVEIKLSNSSGKQWIYLDKLDGTEEWRLCYTSLPVDDVSKLEAIEINRE